MTLQAVKRRVDADNIRRDAFNTINRIVNDLVDRQVLKVTMKRVAEAYANAILATYIADRAEKGNP